MHAKGGVWFARLDQGCDHVQQLMAAGRWTPRYETSRYTKARSPNSPMTIEQGQEALPALAIIFPDA